AVGQMQALPEVKRVTSYLDALQAVPSLELLPEQERALVQEQITAQRLAKDRAAIITVISSYEPDSAETKKLVERLRAMDIDGATMHVTGSSAYNIDIVDRIYDSLPYTIAFVMGITFL